MRILVTGADGFAGPYLCELLRAAGDEVVEAHGPRAEGASMTALNFDIADEAAVRAAVEKARPEGIIHLAAFSSVARSHGNPARVFAVNALGTVNLLTAVRESAPEARVLLISSGEVYGPVPEGARASEEQALVPLSRGAVLHKERLYLELIAESLPQRGVQRSPLALRPAHLMESPPERALVFESQGRLFGLPLGLVSQVVTCGEAFSRLPVQRGAVAGVFPHAQVLWPIFSVPAMLGGSAEVEAFFVLTEMAGQNVGLCATRVLGVLPRFEPTEEKGEFRANGLPGPVLFLDLQHMFS